MATPAAPVADSGGSPLLRAGMPRTRWSSRLAHARVSRMTHVVDASCIPVRLIRPIERLGDHRVVDAIRAAGYRSVSLLVASLQGTPVS